MWRIDGETLTRLPGEGSSAGLILVPSERVLTLVVDLPLSSRAEKLAALPFAVEDQVADPLDAVHVALGAEVGPQRHLAGVVRHEVMIQWLAAAAAAGVPRASVAPDYLGLPRPAAGWTLRIEDGRALVRTAEGPGFALPAEGLEAAWIGAGRPPVDASGDVPPALMSTSEAALTLATDAPAGPPMLDLRQGPYMPRGRPELALMRRLALVALAGLTAHTLVLAADAWALSRTAASRRAETAALARQAAPGLSTDGDLIAALAPLLEADPGTARSRFFPLFSRTSAALRPLSDTLTLQSLSFAADGALTLEVQAPDIAAVQRVQTTLTAAGLSAAGGSAANVEGRAGGRITVREGAAS